MTGGSDLDASIVAAALDGDAETLGRLLAEHPGKIRLTGGQWNQPLLHLAAGRGHLAVVDLLLGLGADPDERDPFDRASALHWAAASGNVELVHRLIDAGADVDGEGDDHEMRVIGWATCFRHVHRAVAALLLERGARPTIFAAVALDRGDLVRRLVEGDRRLLFRQMSRFEHRATPLHLAVSKNRPDMVALLLDLGADPMGKDDRGRTPLSRTSSRTDKRIADLLVAAGADPGDIARNRFESAVPILNVADVPASIAYYVDKLGFAKEWDWGTPPTFACVRRDGVRIFLCRGGQGAPGTWISIFVDDVDALHADYRRTGAIIRQPPTDYPWGLREMNVEDLDGHRLRLGSEAPAADA
jgi:hypothetical protein